MANPTSVKARRLTSRLVPALESAGWDVLQTGRAPGESAEEVAGRVEGSAALVVVGGDGTVRLVSDVARLTGIPMWQTSAGNENLFARSLNMHKGATSLLAALEQRRVHRIDRLRVGDRSSLLMLSSGFDADIVERVTASRTGAVSNRHYLLPTIKVLSRWKPSRFTVRSDGDMVISGRRGWLVVANSPDYGGRFDPVPGALMDDGRLDVLFVPMQSGLDAFDWIIRCRLGLAHRDSRLLRGRSVEAFRASHVQIDVDPASAWQIDGDPMVTSEVSRMGSVEVSIEEGVIPVLLPVSEGASMRALSRGPEDHG